VQKGKIINLNDCYISKLDTPPVEKPISEELQKAIQNLIHQLREKGPLTQ
jgi:hypothetical protein